MLNEVKLQFMPYRMTPSVRHRAIEVHYYYYYYDFLTCNNTLLFTYIHLVAGMTVCNFEICLEKINLSRM